MSNRSLRTAIVVSAAVVLSGCDVLGVNFTDDKVKYESSNTRANLEVPPDLTPVPNENRYAVPDRPGVVSANAEAAKAAAQGDAAAQGEDRSKNIVKRTVVSKVMREGNERWLRVNVEADKLWPVVQDFWTNVGLQIKRQDAKTGYLETEWAENKARLPQDIIRATIGKVLDFAYSTGERDQYRCRVERNADGTSDVFVTHRSMVEVVTGAQNDSTMWQPGPSDPTLEAEMMQRLALHIDSQFNPEAEPLKKADVEKQFTPDVPKQARSEIVKAADGSTEAVLLSEPYDRAWRTVGLVVDRMGFELVDRDRSSGFYQVRYLDPKYEEREKSKRGFFSRMFNSDAAVEVPEYRIRLAGEGDKTRITVVGGDGSADKTGVAPTILTLLAEQLR
jgi:outer membrane protein assembly factor BamC